MATVSKERRGNWQETDRRVRHPLQAVRGYIRQYVILEGLGLSLLYVSVAFWLGLAFDWGLFQVTGVDWIQMLQNLTKDSGIDMYVRGLLLTVVVLGLASVAVTKTLLRLFREFTDKAMALLLERRFPRELGDRLITAVELANPSKSEKYGFSLPLTEKTIRDAADRVEKLPVKGVFNWARLRWIYVWCAVCTIGLFSLTGAAVCVIRSASPLEFVGQFNEVAGIWVDRNLLLQDVHWPRQAYLELLGFRASASNASEMRVGAGEQREPLRVRAIKWLKGDPAVSGGWAPLEWKDLEHLLGQDASRGVNLEPDWNGWILDPYDRQGDWRDWTVDQVWRQYENRDVRVKMEVGCYSSLGEVFGRLETLADESGMGRKVRKLTIPKTVDVYSSDKTGRTVTPDITMGSNNKFDIGLGSVDYTTTFTVRGLDFYTPYRTIAVVPPPSLLSLTADRLEPAYVYYRLRGGDQMPLKNVKHATEREPLALTGISLVKTAIGSDVVLHGEIADVDKGRKLHDISLRKIEKKDRLEGEKEDQATVPTEIAEISSDRTTFTLTLPGVVTTYDFIMEFRDEDKAVGKRRIRVEVQADNPPEVALEIEQEKQLRRPRMRGKKAKELPAAAADAWLITADATLPLRGRLRDDYGITDGSWIARLELADIQFSGDAGKPTDPAKDPKDPKDVKEPVVDPKVKKVDLAKSTAFELALPLRQYLYEFQRWENELEFDERNKSITVDQIHALNAAEHNSVAMAELVRKGKLDEAEPLVRDLLDIRKRILGEDHKEVAKARRLLGNLLKDRGDSDQARMEFELAQMIDQLPDNRRSLKWEKDQRDDFRISRLREAIDIDVRRSLTDPKRKPVTGFVPRLKPVGSEPQLYYFLYLTLSATDNNVDKGPTTTKGKSAIKFLIVSDTEFLAQIAEDEEALSQRLEEAYKTLDKARVRLKELYERLSLATPPTYDDVRNRISLAQMMLAESSLVTREVFREYERINSHLEFNQARIERAGQDPIMFGSVHEKFKKVKNSIVTPLAMLTTETPEILRDPKMPPVEFPSTEAAIKKLVDAAEEERRTGQAGNVPSDSLARRKLETADARDRVDRLMVELNKVLIEMQQVVTYAKSRDMVERIARDEKARAEEMQRLYEQRYKDLMKELGL